MKQITRVGAYGVITRESEILLCQLTRSRFWTLPGGGIEFGETPVDAMVREVFEETGYVVEAGKLIGVNSFVVEGEDQMHFIQIIFTAHVKGGALRAELDGTTDLCEWQEISNIASLDVTRAVEYAMEHV